jgi:hypothetical protein
MAAHIRNKKNLQNNFTPDKHTGNAQIKSTDDNNRNFDGSKPYNFNFFIVIRNP